MRTSCFTHILCKTSLGPQSDVILDGTRRFVGIVTSRTEIRDHFRFRSRGVRISIFDRSAEMRIYDLLYRMSFKVLYCVHLEYINRKYNIINKNI